MQSLTQKVFHLSPPGGLFDETVVVNAFPDSSPGARALLVHRACQSGEVIRLKPGLFLLAPPYRKSTPHPFQIAAALQFPSHISFESALSHHGLIPEAVFQVSSASISRTREYRTPVGVFSFHCVPVGTPSAGVETVRLEPHAWAFIATPLRAIADLVYVNKAVTWERDGLAYLVESLRIEETDVHTLRLDRLDEILSSFRSRRVRAYLKGLRGAIRHV